MSVMPGASLLAAAPEVHGLAPVDVDYRPGEVQCTCGARFGHVTRTLAVALLDAHLAANGVTR